MAWHGALHLAGLLRGILQRHIAVLLRTAEYTKLALAYDCTVRARYGHGTGTVLSCAVRWQQLLPLLIGCRPPTARAATVRPLRLELEHALQAHAQ